MTYLMAELVYCTQRVVLRFMHGSEVPVMDQHVHLHGYVLATLKLYDHGS